MSRDNRVRALSPSLHVLVSVPTLHYLIYLNSYGFPLRPTPCQITPFAVYPSVNPWRLANQNGLAPCES